MSYANCQKSGKNLFIYRFGGSGNDWCFVRTPENYDPSGKKACPFVICNHGNGWNMDGSARFANWTKRTMYLPSDDPDASKNPEQYSITEDQSLFYSNPMTEHLLKNGYVVCGCQNHGDLLFGNDDCRSACADFFYHMVKTYNVEDECNMLGASNGALTSINAVYLLGKKIKALVLLYPLTCLINQYDTYPQHRKAIRDAYGISDENISSQELESVLKSHDLLHNGVVNGKLDIYFPPTEIFYSKSDSVVNCRANALSAEKLLVGSGVFCETIEAKGEHGDFSHFDPEAVLEWFESHK